MRTFLSAFIIATLLTGGLPRSAVAGDIESVEQFLNAVHEERALALCREPFYPPGDCRPARFTEGVRYNWVHSSDARSNEFLALIHDTQRNGSSPVFHSTIPGYDAMRLSRTDPEAWCMPEYSGAGALKYHARIGGFRESGRNPSGRPLARYGLYLVAETETKCLELLDLGRQLLD